MDCTFCLSVGQWIFGAVGSVLLGISRTAIRGSSFLAIPIFAEIFGGRASAGLVLTLLLTGDLVAVRHYLQNTEWRRIWPLLPWAAVGIAAGVAVGRSISDLLFKRIIALIVLASVVPLAFGEWRQREIAAPNRWWISAVLGVIGGFSSMIGNVAGPIMNLYFLSMGLKKRDFIGTVAWFFFILNVIKVPFHVFVWGTINARSLTLTAIAAGPVILGAFLGIWITKRISERHFRFAILALVAVAALRLLVFG